MTTLCLRRIAEAGEAGTFGVLIHESVPFAVTCERPWKDNRPEVSCIPAGSYAARRTISPHFGETFEVQNVPNRSDILLHKGNVATDSKGCILIGGEYSRLEGVPSIGLSKYAFAKFMDILKDEGEFQLTITAV